MAAIESLWWLGFFGVFGLCVGSFLNAAIYRIPRDVSLRVPLWSFCPRCDARIRWYDNLPLLSYVLLRGRCRACGGCIPSRYPIVEAITAIIVLLLLDAFFIAHTHVGVGFDVQGISWQLSEDWPIFLAHIILFAALLAMSAIDLDHYWVDVRFSTIATAAGFLLHAVWTPNRLVEWHRPSPAMAAGAIVVTVVLLATLFIIRRLCGHDAAPADATTDEAHDSGSATSELSESAVSDPPAQADPAEETTAASSEAEETEVGSLWAGHAAAVLLVGCAGVLMYGAWAQASGIGPPLGTPIRWLPCLLMLLLLIIAAAAPRRASDQAIVVAIEAERPTARRTAVLELLCLLPAVLLGAITTYYAASCGETAARVDALLGWAPIDGWHPLEGLGTAAAGFVIGGGIGWAVRICGTLALGKEAFGSGDIHMMAAAGCVAGWPVASIGFVLCSLLALGGWLVILPFKRARAIPLGPWLALAFLVVVVLYDQVLGLRPIENMTFLFREFTIR